MILQQLGATTESRNLIGRALFRVKIPLDDIPSAAAVIKQKYGQRKILRAEPLKLTKQQLLVQNHTG